MHATFCVASHAHEQYICHIKTSAPVFQQMNLSHKILANVHGQINVVTDNLLVWMRLKSF